MHAQTPTWRTLRPRPGRWQDALAACTHTATDRAALRVAHALCHEAMFDTAPKQRARRASPRLALLHAATWQHLAEVGAAYEQEGRRSAAAAESADPRGSTASRCTHTSAADAANASE